MLNRERLDAAVGCVPQWVFGEPAYPSLAAMAAAYIFGIAKGHAFLDGNKRTGLATGGAFLYVNNIERALVHPAWADIVEAVVNNIIDRETLVQFVATEMPNGDPVRVVT